MYAKWKLFITNTLIVIKLCNWYLLQLYAPILFIILDAFFFYGFFVYVYRYIIFCFNCCEVNKTSIYDTTPLTQSDTISTQNGPNLRYFQNGMKNFKSCIDFMYHFNNFYGILKKLNNIIAVRLLGIGQRIEQRLRQLLRRYFIENIRRHRPEVIGKIH